MRLAVLTVSPPQVVDELAPADDAGDHWAGVDADADLQRPAVRAGAPGHLVADLQRHLGHRPGVVGPRLGKPAGRHVGVADRLDLLQPLVLGDPVERGEQVVQGRHHLLRGDPLAVPGEVHQVGEQHGDVGEAVGDHVLALLEPVGDRGGQDVEQQPLRPFLLDRERAAAAYRLAQQQHGGQ
jgi:hypothetical protein